MINRDDLDYLPQPHDPPSSRRERDEMDERRRQRERRLDDDEAEMRRLENERHEIRPSITAVPLDRVVVFFTSKNGQPVCWPPLPFDEACARLKMDSDEKIQARAEIVFHGEYSRVAPNVPAHFAEREIFRMVRA